MDEARGPAPAKKKLRYRRGGSVVAALSLTLDQQPDASIIAALESAPSMSRLVADALRAYVARFASLNPTDRFRVRRDGRLVLSVDLEFQPDRDKVLIDAILEAAPHAVPALLVSIMRDGGARQASVATEVEMELDGLGADL